MLTAGESHGKALVATLEGMPAGVPISPKALADELARRRLGHGRSGRQKFETDLFEILTGVRHGRSLGSPIAVVIPNSEWDAKYSELMGVEGEIDPSDKLTRPRPGHADMVGIQKYGFDDVRNVLERASARETAARVAIGCFAKAFLAELGIAGAVSRRADRQGRRGRARRLPRPEDLEGIDASPVRCFDPAVSERMVAEIDAVRKSRDTIGGAFEVLAYGCPPGLGSLRPLRPQDRRAAVTRADGYPVGQGSGGGRRLRLGGAARVEGARRDHVAGGSHHPQDDASGRHRGRHDDRPAGPDPRCDEAVLDRAEAARDRGHLHRSSAVAIKQRTDVCAVPAGGVVGEAAVAFVLADAVLEKFGGDSLPETRRNLESYVDTLR